VPGEDLEEYELVDLHTDREMGSYKKEIYINTKSQPKGNTNLEIISNPDDLQHQTTAPTIGRA
jgi:hypothetical protein